MGSDQKCPRCGKALGKNRLKGLCPECLMHAGAESEVMGAEAGPAAKQLAGFVPPTPGELAPHFPGLEILELVGKGGMGAVYKARQRGLGRWVALKILPPVVSNDPAFAERFTREAQALARLNHPNIVTVHEAGQSGGLYYFVMEFIEGLTLRQLMQTQKLSPREAMEIVPRICEALQYAHDQGIVHRDIKPENILMDQTGRVKIADFGLAKVVGAPVGLPLTRPAEVMGTPAYMAPEQIEHPQDVDHRADIFSLGVVFYEMLTGELPLGRFAPPSRKVQVDVRLDDVVLRALEKEPELRYQQVSQMKTQVEIISTTVAPAPVSDSWAGRYTVWLVTAGAAVVLLLVAGLAYWWFSGWPGLRSRQGQNPQNLRPVRITTYAGSVAGDKDGPLSEATFYHPYRIKMDARGRMWVTEATTTGFWDTTNGGHRIRMIDTRGIVHTIAGSSDYGLVEGPGKQARFRVPDDLALDSKGNVFVVDNQNHRIRKIDTQGMVSTFAGSEMGFQDGAGVNARFNLPTSLVIDKNNNIFVADFGNLRIRKVTQEGEVSTYAGKERGFQDGERISAAFDSPIEIALAADGTLFVSDWKNGAIRKISTNGLVTTVMSVSGYFTESLGLDSQGSLYASFSHNNLRQFQKLSQSGQVIWSINSEIGFQDGDIGVAQFANLSPPIVLPNGSLLAADMQNHRLRLISMAPSASAQKK